MAFPLLPESSSRGEDNSLAVSGVSQVKREEL